MFGFANAQEIPVPIIIDRNLLLSIPERFEDEKHFWQVLEWVVETLNTCADPVLHWSAEEANFALHMLLNASSRVGGPASIRADCTFRGGRELIGTPKQRMSRRQKHLLAMAEDLQVVLLKSS
jgi:hypothetical protein